MATTKIQRRKKIKLRVRKQITGTPQRPRLSVYRSNKGIYSQIIDDLSGSTLVAASSQEVTGKSENKIDQAKKVGQIIAQKAMDQKINEVVFDRSGYLYHGRVKALADGAREKGLKL